MALINKDANILHDIWLYLSRKYFNNRAYAILSVIARYYLLIPASSCCDTTHDSFTLACAIVRTSSDPLTAIIDIHEVIISAGHSHSWYLFPLRLVLATVTA